MFGKFYVIPTKDKGTQFFNLLRYEDLLSLRKSVQFYCIAVKSLLSKNVKGKQPFQLVEFNLKKQQYNKTKQLETDYWLRQSKDKRLDNTVEGFEDNM